MNLPQQQQQRQQDWLLLPHHCGIPANPQALLASQLVQILSNKSGDQLETWQSSWWLSNCSHWGSKRPDETWHVALTQCTASCWEAHTSHHITAATGSHLIHCTGTKPLSCRL